MKASGSASSLMRSRLSPRESIDLDTCLGLTRTYAKGMANPEPIDGLGPQNIAPAGAEATTPATPETATGKRCQSRNKRGMSCTAWALRGGTQCYFHANPEKMSELGRRGGEVKGAR